MSGCPCADSSGTQRRMQRLQCRLAPHAGTWRLHPDVPRLTDDKPAPEPPVIVPHEQLSADALRGVIEAFVLREGTEYGERDVSLDVKVAQVLRQLQRGEAQIVFDLASEEIGIVLT